MRITAKKIGNKFEYVNGSGGVLRVSANKYLFAALHSKVVVTKFGCSEDDVRSFLTFHSTADGAKKSVRSKGNDSVAVLEISFKKGE